MLDGTFSEAERFAAEAILVAKSCGEATRAQEAHATTTLGVSLGWSDDPEAGVALLHDARRMAEELGDVDELFRVYANLTTVLDLLGRRPEAVDVAYEGIEAARAAGLEAVYGNFLRGNAAESLFLLGRWPESRALSSAALEWSPAGVAFVNSVVNLAIVEIETRAGELAGHLLGQLLLELETVRDSQHAVPVYRAAGLPHMHAPYPCWVAPELRNIPAAETEPPTFIGSVDVLRRALLGRAIELGADMIVRGTGWDSGEQNPPQPQAPHSLRRMITNQLALLRHAGPSAIYFKLQHRLRPMTMPPIPRTSVKAAVSDAE